MNKSRIILATLLTTLLGGSLYSIVKLGFSVYQVKTTTDIVLFAGIRFTLCGAIITAFAAIKNKESFHAAKQSLFPIILTGVFSIVLHCGLSYIGMGLIDSSKTAILKQIGSLLYVCFSFLFFKEDRPTFLKIAGALLGFCGIIALNLSAAGLRFSLGDIIILLSSFCSVFSDILSKRVFQKVSSLTATGIAQFSGGAILLLIGWLTGGTVHFSLDGSLWIMIYICTASILIYSIWYGVIKKGELSKLFIVKFSEPMFACLFGALILKENILKIQYLVAFLLITAGIYVSHLTFQKKKTVKE